jgi:hypothetical protein
MKELNRALQILSIGVLAATLLAGRSPIVAHHAFSAEYDANQPLTLTGTVTQMEWVNPHCWIHIETAPPGGSAEHWVIEAATPNTLLRRGLRKTDLVAGTAITVSGYAAKDKGPRVHGTYVTLADGRRVFLSSALAAIGDDQR